MNDDVAMATETVPPPSENKPPKADPFDLGWRFLKARDENGQEFHKIVPLKPDDLLHPEEDDFVVQNYAHTNDFNYLYGVIKETVRDKPGEIAFGDMRIDWQVDDDSVFGPDIAVFKNLDAPWEPRRGTFPVRTMGAETVFVIEIISPTTEKNDKGIKVSEYQRVGIPLYIIVDYEQDAEKLIVVVYGYRMTPTGYSRIPKDPKGIWIEHSRLWVRSGGEKVVCVDEWGKEIPGRHELTEQRNEFQKERDEVTLRVEQEKQRAEQEKQRAEQEKQRAEQEKQRAEQEKQRADDIARKMVELEAEIRRLRGDTK